MNDFDFAGIYNSALIFSYLLKTKSPFLVYLEDGSKLGGVLLGMDSDFLVIQEGKNLQMVQIKKVSRLQTEFEESSASQTVTKREVSATAPAPIISEVKLPVEELKAKFKPVLKEVSATSERNDSDNSQTAQPEVKEKLLDALVKNL